MFQALNLPELIEKTRNLADIRDSSFQSDSEIQDLLEDSFDLLFNKLVKLNENYYLKETEVTAQAGGDIPLPDDLYKIRLLTKKENGIPIYEKSLAELTQDDNPVLTDYIYSSPEFTGYCFFPSKIRVFPRESSQGVKFDLYYVRDPLSIQNENLQKSWERYLAYKTAYIITTLQQNPNHSLGDLAKEQQRAIEIFAKARNTGIRKIRDLERNTYNHIGVF